MAVVKGEKNKAASPRQKDKIKLGRLVKSWKDIADQMRSIKAGETPNPGASGQPSRLDKLEEQLRARQERISSILSNRPGLITYTVQKLGYEGPVPARSTSGSPKQGEVAQTQGGDTEPEAKLPKTRNKNNNNGKDHGAGGDRLPGDKGTSYSVVRYKGNTYVVYNTPIPGSKVKVKMTYRVRPKDLNNQVHGFGPGEGKVITKSQFRSFNMFGTTNEIVRKKGGNKHPFQKFLRELVRQHPGASWLKSKQVMAILLEAHVENKDQAWTDNMLRNTKWWQKRTADERQWELTAEADKKKTRKAVGADLNARIDALYGPNVEPAIGEKKLARWTEAIASGRVDAQTIYDRIEQEAREIEGTAAWASWTETGRSIAQTQNLPEEMFEKVRSESMRWLGPNSRPNQNTLKGWAASLASGESSEADWMQFLRNQKKAMHAWLDEDTPWQDFAGSYQQIAQNVFRSNVDFSDKLLSNLQAAKEDGTPLARPLTAYEFELMARQDDRAWQKGSLMWDEGTKTASQIASALGGVTF